jgi:hypothetical protein
MENIKAEELLKQAYAAKSHIVIGMPCLPAVVEHTCIQNGFEILLSYGGGMGGCRETLYTFDNITEEMMGKSFFTCKKLNGEEISVFTRFIVYVKPVKYIIIKGTHNNSNYSYQGYNFIDIYAIEPDATYSIDKDHTTINKSAKEPTISFKYK